MKRLFFITLILLTGHFTCIITPTIVHATSLIDFTGTGQVSWTPSGGTGTTRGYSFSVTGEIFIDGFGVFDDGGDGLSNSHEVGLWASNGSLLRSTTVNAGSSPSEASASALGNYVYAATPEMTLNSGTYFLGAFYGVSNADKIRTSATGIFSNAPGVTYISAQSIDNSVLSFPSVTWPAGTTYFGPTLRIANTSNVSVPGAVWLLGSGLIGLFGFRKKYKK